VEGDVNNSTISRNASRITTTIAQLSTSSVRSIFLPSRTMMTQTA
jgi:hypothetical protein